MMLSSLILDEFRNHVQIRDSSGDDSDDSDDSDDVVVDDSDCEVTLTLHCLPAGRGVSASGRPLQAGASLPCRA